MNALISEILEIINSLSKENSSTFTQITLPQANIDLSALGIDSITFIELIVIIEEHFDVEIPDEKLIMSNMNTISLIAETIKELQQQGAVI